MESCHAKWLMATEKPLTDSILHGPERPPSTLTENAFWGPFVNAGFSASGKGSVDLKKKKKMSHRIRMRSVCGYVIRIM